MHHVPARKTATPERAAQGDEGRRTAWRRPPTRDGGPGGAGGAARLGYGRDAGPGSLNNWRLPSGNYELAHAVLVALKEPDAEARWYDGEDIFAHVASDDADRSMDADTRRMEAEYRRALWAVAHGEPAGPSPS